jgi:hypothetical protein
MKEEKEQPKIPYQKPMIRVIELTTEEIMGVCKVSGRSGPAGICNLCANLSGSS